MKYLTANKIKDYRQENRPDYCPISGVTMTNPALDHDHETGMVRGVIDGEVNAFLGRIENAFMRLSHPVRQKALPEMLRGIASFLEQEQTNVLHPKGAVDLAKRFERKTKAEQDAILAQLNAEVLDIQACKNSKERTKLYSKMVKSNKWSKLS